MGRDILFAVPNDYMEKQLPNNQCLFNCRGGLANFLLVGTFLWRCEVYHRQMLEAHCIAFCSVKGTGALLNYRETAHYAHHCSYWRSTCNEPQLD